MKIAFYHELLPTSTTRLCDILTGLLPSSGGMGRIAVASKIAKLGPDVSVYHHFASGPAEEMLNGVRCVRMASVDELSAHLGDLLENDVVVVNVFEDLPRLSAQLATLRCKKIIWAGCNPRFEWCDMLDGYRFDRMICVSNEARQSFRIHPNWPRIGYIYSSVNTPVAIPAAEEPELGSVAFLGALREEKGFHHLLAAWPLVKAAEPRATLNVFGSIRLHFPDAPVGKTGVMSPEFELKHLMPLLGADGDWRRLGINFAFPQTKENLFKKLSQTMVGVVNPNTRDSDETYCLSAVEMQACGCPCIGGGIGGLKETIKDKVSGYLLRTQNPRELADRILQVLRNPELRRKLSFGAQAHSISLSSPEREANDWMNMIYRLNRGLACESERKIIPDLARGLGMGRVKSQIKKWLRLLK